MFGTVCILYPNAGQEAQVLAALDAWQRDISARIGQPVKGIVYRVTESERADSGNGELVVAIAFPDQATFAGVMNQRATDPNYSALLALLSDEPIFLDGPVVWSSLG